MNESSVVAVNNVTNWSGTCYVTPLLGAFLADAYLGRFWTIAAFSIIYVFVSFMTLYILDFSLLHVSSMIKNPTKFKSSRIEFAIYLSCFWITNSTNYK